MAILNIKSLCDGSVPPHLFYGATMSLMAQRLGASGVLIDGATNVGTEKYYRPPSVNINLIQVSGVGMAIPAFIIQREDSGDGLKFSERVYP